MSNAQTVPNPRMLTHTFDKRIKNYEKVMKSKEKKDKEQKKR